jgi:zinc protease
MGETRHALALLVLAELFGGSETSRLSRALVAEAGLALGASAGYSANSLGLSSFGISVHPAHGRNVTEIETAVAAEMKRVLDGDVTTEEVERAQNGLLATAIYSQDSLASGPRLYGSLLATGGTIAEIDHWPQAIAAVQPDDVVAAARHVWRDDRSVTSLLTPAGGWQ